MTNRYSGTQFQFHEYKHFCFADKFPRFDIIDFFAGEWGAEGDGENPNALCVQALIYRESRHQPQIVESNLWNNVFWLWHIPGKTTQIRQYFLAKCCLDIYFLNWNYHLFPHSVRAMALDNFRSSVTFYMGNFATPIWHCYPAVVGLCAHNWSRP